jgi:DNA-binding response OmpR family regulator
MSADLKILHVDDELRWRERVRQELRDISDVVSAEDGQKGLAALNEGAYQVVILDEMMPGEGDADAGLAGVLPRVRESHPSAKVIMLTGVTVGTDLSESDMSTKYGVPFVFKQDGWQARLREHLADLIPR